MNVVWNYFIYFFESLYQENQYEMQQTMPLLHQGKSKQITKAMGWLNLLIEYRTKIPKAALLSPDIARIYQEYEYHKLGTDGVSLLLFLEQLGVLDLETREVIISLALSAQTAAIGIEQLKWLILIILNDKMKRAEYKLLFLQKLTLFKKKLKNSMH